MTLLAILTSLALARSAADLPEPAATTRRSYTVRAFVGPIDTPLSEALSVFLLDHPDLSSDLVRAHGIAPYRVKMTGPGKSDADDGAGIRGTVELLEREGGRRLYFADGVFDRPALPTIKATAVILMRLEPLPGSRCPPKVRGEFEVYVRLKNPVLATVVKTLRPFLTQTAVSRFSRAFVAAQKLGELIAREPEKAFAEIAAHPSLTPDERETALDLALESRQSSLRCRP